MEMPTLTVWPIFGKMQLILHKIDSKEFSLVSFLYSVSVVISL
jgi:hypothetical protein